MGTKVNIFIWCCLIFGKIIDHVNTMSLFITLNGFVFLYNKNKIWRHTNKFPGSGFAKNFATLFGNTAVSFHDSINDLWMKHGRDKFSSWIGFERFLTISKRSDIKAVMSETQDGELMEHFDQMWPWLGGDDIKSKDFSSKFLIESLNDGTLEQLTKSDPFVESLNKKIVAMCEKSITEDEIDVQVAIRRLTFDVICGLALGDKSATQRSNLFEAGERLCEMADQRVYSGWKQTKWLRKALGEESKFENSRITFAEYVMKTINERSASNHKVVGCLLDALMCDEHLSLNEIVATLVGFIVLGYDRLASSTCLALGDLAKRPEIQKQLRSDSLKIEKFIQESQRLHPAVPLIPKLVPVGVPLNGFFIPAESSVFLYLSGMNRDVARVVNPDEFDANRANLSETIKESLATTVTTAILESLVAKYRMTAEKKSDKFGCGITMRPTRFNILFESK